MPRALIRPAKAIGPAEHFVGRREELAIFAEMRGLASTAAMPQLAVLQAPPGAGKTALLAEAATRAAAESYVVLDVPAPALDSPELLRDLVVSQIARRDRWKDLVPAMEFGLPGAAGGVSVTRPRMAPASMLLKGLQSLSRRSGPDGRGPAGILLLLDEAQRLVRRDEAAVDLLLEALRGQPGLRTLAILSGLPDTLDALDSPSLARVDRILGLGPLRREESVELFRLWLEDNAFSAESGASLDEIAAHAQDWPEHLMHHISPMLEGAATNGGVVDAGVAAHANEAAEPAMRDYYDRRLGLLRGRLPSEHQALAGLARAATALDGELSFQLVQEIIERAGAGPDLALRLAHAGVLVESEGRWRFAIPSLRTYILETRDPLAPELAAAVDEVVAAVVGRSRRA